MAQRNLFRELCVRVSDEGSLCSSRREVHGCFMVFADQGVSILLAARAMLLLMQVCARTREDRYATVIAKTNRRLKKPRKKIHMQACYWRVIVGVAWAPSTTITLKCPSRSHTHIMLHPDGLFHLSLYVPNQLSTNMWPFRLSFSATTSTGHVPWTSSALMLQRSSRYCPCSPSQ